MASSVRPGLDGRSLRFARANGEVHGVLAAGSEFAVFGEQGVGRSARLGGVQDFDQEVLITRCSNNYGPYQFPEKLIPLIITNALADKKLPVYGDGLNVRDWIHVEDHCRGIMAVLLEGRPGEVYNLGGDGEMENIAVVELILQTLGKPHDLISYVADRLGHDRRYAIDSTKIQSELGWKPLHKPREGIRQTVQWYLDNRTWWERLLAKPVAVT